MKRTMTKHEPQTVAAASAVLTGLEAKLARHRERAVELEAERKQASFGAHALHDAKQRKALADVVDQSIRHETEGRAIGDAIEEARRRLAISTAYEADVADRAKARHALELLAAFQECGRELDSALQTVAETGRILPNLLSQLHAAGVRSPNRDQFDALGYAAVLTSLGGTIWGRRFEPLAPNRRQSFRALVDAWVMAAAPRLRAQLGENDEAA